ncbi:GNAT family N-acetyltransferase [Phaeobacter inhibens]|nr:GNAT family N-acetyltransferase [Phaeobacter inhibens]
MTSLKAVHCTMCHLGLFEHYKSEEALLMVKVRQAVSRDAKAMSAILAAIQVTWKTSWSSTPEYILKNYLLHPDRIRCSVAIDEADRILGFQSLKRASEGNPFQVTVGWGVVGTFVDLNMIRRGVGRALWASTLRAAQDAELKFIDATIEPENTLGLGYYDAIGFRTYRKLGNAIGKKFAVPAAG